MYRRLIILALLLKLSCFTAGVAAAAIDETFQKTDHQMIWGKMLEWALGSEGFGKSFALVVGISTYTSGFETLRSTMDDPIRMKDFLLDEAGFDYVHVLTDEKATKRRIGTLLEEVFPDLVEENDRFLLYWSGHGTQTMDAIGKPLGYLPLSDSGTRQFSSMVSMDDLNRWDRRIRARHALFLLDACFSGLAGSEAKNNLRDFTIARLSKPAHHIVTAGSGEEQTIAHGRWQGSLFTDTFIKAARGAADAQNDFPRDGVVNLAELMAYVRQRIDHERHAAKWTETITPQWNHLRANQGEFFFVTADKKREVARVGTDVPIVAGMPEALGAVKKPLVQTTCDREADRLFWETIKDKREVSYFEAYTERVKAGELCGRFAALAEIELAKLKEITEVEPVRLTPEPAGETLPPERILQIQKMLDELGFDPGVIDGLLGPRTKRAVTEFQRTMGVAGTGQITDEVEMSLAKEFADIRAQRREVIGAARDRASANAAEDEEKPSVAAAATQRPPTKSVAQELPSAAIIRFGAHGNLQPSQTVFEDCEGCPQMVELPEGRFDMGSADGDPTERPVHAVTIGHSLALGKFEITVAEWKACVEADYCPNIAIVDKAEPNRAMRNVSWTDAKTFTSWLKTKTGKPYRLPTEAEWEYAARGGMASARFWWGDATEEGRADCAGCGGDWDRRSPANVGAFPANPFGLHDMNGGVSEWVADCWNSTYVNAATDGSARTSKSCRQRVLRGGSWRSKADQITSSSRASYDAPVRYYTNGFRVARELR